MLPKEVKVVGVDKVRTHKSDSEQPTFDVYFELSIVPSVEWKEIFENSDSVGLNSRKFWVDGRHVVVQCLFSEIDDVLKEVRKEVARTNNEYVEGLRKKS